MKIACIGNMNNMLSPTAQFLAEEGHDVTLILLYEYEHFAPEADYFDKNNIGFKIEKLQMDFAGVMNVPKAKLLAIFSGYDYYIGTDYAPALLYRINIKLNVFYPAGTDIYEWPFYEYENNIPKLWQFEKIRTANYQMKGIQKTDILTIGSNNAFLDQKVSKVGFKNKIVNPLPFLYYKQYKKEYFIKSQFYHQIKKIKESSDVLIIQHGRQWWKTAPSEFNKGNDILVLGIKQLVDKNPNLKLKLLLLEYGQDVEETKKLAEQLHLQNFIIWLPKMLRKDLMGIISLCDIGIGETGTESWYLYCSNAEIIACDILFMGYRNDSYHVAKGDYLYPMANVSNPDSICDEILKHINHSKTQVKRGNANEWLHKYNYTVPINIILQHIKEKKKSNCIIHFIDKSLFDLRINILEFISKSTFHFSKVLSNKKAV